MDDSGRQGAGHIRGGGGIVFGEIGRNPAPASASPRGVMNAIRRRWASGVAILTVVGSDGGFRGVTATSFVVVSVEPPVIAVALSLEGSFHALLENGTAFGVSILDGGQTFLADRFAGRAPVPDSRFGGVPHVVHASGVPLIKDVVGWCICQVSSLAPVGDHILLLGELLDGGTGTDTDDPLVSYEGRYRSIEAG